jgi:hypothetical protein
LKDVSTREKHPGGSKRTDAGDFTDDERRRAVLVGFHGSLERAIVDVIEPQGLVVTTVEAPERVAAHFTSLPHLVVVSGRCGLLSVLELVGRLGAPRSTRVVVLLHAPDAEVERAYRAAGIRMVLTMPVGLHALLAAGSLEDE